MTLEQLAMHGNTWAHAALWAISTLYTVAFIPQIILNHQRKSTSSLSDIAIGGLVGAYAAFTFHVYCLNLPAPYRVTVPIALGLVSTIASQCLYFHGKTQHIYLFYFLTLCLAISSIAVPLALHSPEVVGKIAGWIAALIWTVYLIPQGYKVWQAQSLEGISFLFPTLIFIGSLLECSSALFLGLPLATIFIALRGIIIYFVYLGFYLYLKKKK